MLQIKKYGGNVQKDTNGKLVFIVEIMGHKVGLMTLYAGLAGGADIILIPEIPYHIDAVCNKILERYKYGSKFSIIAVAEGAISYEDSLKSKKDYKKKLAERKYPSVSYELADEVFKRTGIEVRVTVPGHTQRGGAPVPYDRVLATRFGIEAAQLIKKQDFGNMVALVKNDIVKVPLKDIAGKLKYVNPDSQIVKEAKLLGISFGD